VVRINEARDFAAVVVTADGRRVPVRLHDVFSAEVTLPSILRVIGLGLLALITGSRRETGGRRRERR
jgi:hypothetical protein